MNRLTFLLPKQQPTPTSDEGTIPVIHPLGLFGPVLSAISIPLVTARPRLRGAPMKPSFFFGETPFEVRDNPDGVVIQTPTSAHDAEPTKKPRNQRFRGFFDPYA